MRYLYTWICPWVFSSPGWTVPASSGIYMRSSSPLITFRALCCTHSSFSLSCTLQVQDCTCTCFFCTCSYSSVLLNAFKLYLVTVKVIIFLYINPKFFKSNLIWLLPVHKKIKFAEAKEGILAHTVRRILFWLCKGTASCVSLIELFIVLDMWIWIKEFAVLKKNNVGIQSSDFSEVYSGYWLPFRTEVHNCVAFQNFWMHYFTVLWVQK